MMDGGMSVRLRLVCAGALCAAVAACGGSSSSGSSNKQQISHLFSSLESAMAQGNYSAACDNLSQHQQAAIVTGAKQAGLSATTCTAAFQDLIKTAGVSKAQLQQAFGGQTVPNIRSISVHGNQATVTYTATMDGQTFTETDGLVKENGQWKADRTISRHNGK
jgi:Putative lumazine-binding